MRGNSFNLACRWTVVAFLFCLTGFSLMWRPAEAFKLPDTGQNKCYDNDSLYDANGSCPQATQDFFGQDAHRTKNPPAYENPGDGTILDWVTFLRWQRSDAHNNSRLRTWSEANSYCEALVLGENYEWRLPTRAELMTITKMDYREIAIDDQFAISGTHSLRYWTSTPSSAYYAYVDFSEGSVGRMDGTGPAAVRCVGPAFTYEDVEDPF